MEKVFRPLNYPIFVRLVYRVVPPEPNKRGFSRLCAHNF